jgi:ankyrin repeat protein
VEVVGILIERGADVTAQINSGSTLLHLALQEEQPEVACILIKHGADVTARTEDGWSPLHLAIRCGQVTHLQVIEVVSMLIENGADVNLIDNGLTLLHLAARDGHARINGKLASMLIKRGADVAAKTTDGSTPSHLASQEGQLEAARILIESGADVSAQDNSGSTPLHRVSAPLDMGQIQRRTWPSHFADIVSLLLEHGADVTERNNDGRTPFDLASSGGPGTGLREVAGVLLQHGAIKSHSEETNKPSSSRM